MLGGAILQSLDLRDGVVALSSGGLVLSQQAHHALASIGDGADLCKVFLLGSAGCFLGFSDLFGDRLQLLSGDLHVLFQLRLLLGSALGAFQQLLWVGARPFGDLSLIRTVGGDTQGGGVLLLHCGQPVPEVFRRLGFLQGCA